MLKKILTKLVEIILVITTFIALIMLWELLEPSNMA
tara:strand:+ start:738 stop:845 length:108 start_codon:yes stop_codon:yes gene_type:complete